MHIITIDSKSNFQQANDLIPEQIAQLEAIESRAEEIEVMDKSILTKVKRKALCQELNSMKRKSGQSGVV